MFNKSNHKNFTIAIIAFALILVVEAVIFGIMLNNKTEELAKAASSTAFAKGVDNVYIQVRIKKETKDGMFTDSLYYTAEEWAKASKETVEKAIQDRVDRWVKVTTGK